MQTPLPVTVRVSDVKENEVPLMEASEAVMDAARAMIEKGAWSFVITRGACR